MVRMSDVWDRASQVIAGRAGILASIAVIFLWLPRLVSGAVQAMMIGPDATPGMALVGRSLALMVVQLAVLVFVIVGQLALVAVASDPAVSRGDALDIARQRFWAYLGLILVVVVAAMVLIAPLGIAFASAYPSIAAMQSGVRPQMSPGTGVFVLLYSLAVAVLVLWVQARLLSVLAPVIVNERLGLGSFARAFALTRGLGWRIVGVILLFAVVAIVVVVAVQSVVGITLRLALGAEHVALAGFLTGAVMALVGCAISVVVSAFTAQLYLACRGPAVADTFA